MKISQIIYNLFSIIVIITALLVLVSVFPITGNYKFFIVQSGSMEPAIKTGSVVIVKPQMEYEEGDIISFQSEGERKNSITHRIVGVETSGEEKYFITKGDANNATDTNKVAEEMIIGKVLFAVSYAGYAVAAAKEPLGFALVIVIPAGIIIFEEVMNIKKELAKKSREKESTTV